MKESLIQQLKTQEQFFLNTISCFTEEDSGFKPEGDVYTVAQHIGHVADIIPWFLEGAFGKNGFDMDFENYTEKIKKFTSLDEAVAYLKECTAKGIEIIKNVDDAELVAPITGEIMKGAPKMAVVGGIADHTAHHRGALSVYARLIGKTPKMPYGSM